MERGHATVKQEQGACLVDEIRPLGRNQQSGFPYGAAESGGAIAANRVGVGNETTR